MGWDRHKLLWDGMGQKNMSHGQACESLRQVTYARRVVQLGAQLLISQRKE